MCIYPNHAAVINVSCCLLMLALETFTQTLLDYVVGVELETKQKSNIS